MSQIITFCVYMVVLWYGVPTLILSYAQRQALQAFLLNSLSALTVTLL